MDRSIERVRPENYDERSRERPRAQKRYPSYADVRPETGRASGPQRRRSDRDLSEAVRRSSTASSHRSPSQPPTRGHSRTSLVSDQGSWAEPRPKPLPRRRPSGEQLVQSSPSDTKISTNVPLPNDAPPPKQLSRKASRERGYQSTPTDSTDSIRRPPPPANKPKDRKPTPRQSSEDSRLSSSPDVAVRAVKSETAARGQHPPPATRKKVVYYQNRFITLPAEQEAGDTATQSGAVGAARGSDSASTANDENAGEPCTSTYRRTLNMSQIELDDTSVTMQGGGPDPRATEKTYIIRTSGMTKKNSVFKKLARLLQDNRMRKGTREMQAKLRSMNKNQEVAHKALKNVLNVIFVSTGVVLLLSVIGVIIYTSLAKQPLSKFGSEPTTTTDIITTTTTTDHPLSRSSTPAGTSEAETQPALSWTTGTALTFQLTFHIGRKPSVVSQVVDSPSSSEVKPPRSKRHGLRHHRHRLHPKR